MLKKYSVANIGIVFLTWKIIQIFGSLYQSGLIFIIDKKHML